MPKRVMIIAGEASGDLHGSGVVRELKRLDPSMEIFGVGGDKMAQAGAELIYHVREVAVMGFWEVMKHLPVLRSMNRTLEQLLKFRRPDVVVLIDYPGFNLRFAPIAKRYGIKIVYYISPQVWAWHAGRVRKMRGVVDKMLVIFPFEVDIYQKEGIDAEFVGHPLVEVLESKMDKASFSKRFSVDREKKILALFPGSRQQEITQLFEEMLDSARLIAREIDMVIAIGVAPTIDEQYFDRIYDLDGIHLIKGATYELMHHADFALVKSGTSTLETAWFGTPMFVLYKTSWLTYLIGRLLVRTKQIGLVNIVAGKKIVPEFVQHRAKASTIAREAIKLLRDPSRLNTMREALAEVQKRLGGEGASQTVAKRILEMVKA